MPCATPPGPIITLVGLQIAFLISGSVIVEEVFVRPGLGRLLVRSIFQRDYAVVQGVTLLFTVIFVAANLLADGAARRRRPARADADLNVRRAKGWNDLEEPAYATAGVSSAIRSVIRGSGRVRTLPFNDRRPDSARV